jgi:Tfp pilus assembly protein PilP
VRKKRGNSITLSLLLNIAAIPIFLGITSAQTENKVIFKIPKDKKVITETSEKPIAEEIKAEGIEPQAIEDDAKMDYSYDPTNKVDPFKSFIIVRRELEEKEKKKPKTYLETLDLSQLTLSAIVLTDKENWALVRDSKGDGHVIKAGTAIGRRGGLVIKILEKEVIVREYHVGLRGRETVRDIPIELPPVD